MEKSSKKYKKLKKWEKKSEKVNYSQMAPNGSKWLQNYSKYLQMTMAKANGYGNGPSLSQMVQGLRTKD